MVSCGWFILSLPVNKKRKPTQSTQRTGFPFFPSAQMDMTRPARPFRRPSKHPVLGNKNRGMQFLHVLYAYAAGLRHETRSARTAVAAAAGEGGGSA